MFGFLDRVRQRWVRRCQACGAGDDNPACPMGTVSPKRIFWLSLALALAFALPPTVGGQEALTAGWLERVILQPQKLVFTAKLDTGAKHASLNASDVEVFDQDGDRWVRFTVKDRKGRSISLEKPLVRMAQVKLRNEALQARPVVHLDICLGPLLHTVEVNLVDRSFFNYQLLIGRGFLKNGIVVDASRTFMTRPHCQGGADE